MQAKEYTFLFQKISSGVKTLDNERSRAWIEINTENLKYNAKLLQSLMPSDCEMMAVVKANAYGHGAVGVSKCLNEIGIKAFAVATLEEGIELRKNGIRGDILILGHTDIRKVNQLLHYHLIQTVIDYEYAVMLNRCKKSIEVHLKIDTGMHRMGIRAEEIDKIAEVFQMKGLKISGVYTHLSSADSLEKDAVKFAWHQIDEFYYLLRQLTNQNIVLPKLHIQSTYGMLNYPELECDYVRPGIALYGSLSRQGDHTMIQPQLRPVLSLKARVATIRDVTAGEAIGYGRDSIMAKDSKVAVLSIGYADGLPRNLSGTGYVLLHGRRAPIIGICMDQMLVDITGIMEANKGDVATLIGCDGEEEIAAVSVANNVNSITNELFSRLGSRIERVYL
jgi:alanine racemase